LVGERVYKRPIDKEKAFHMIISGECGVFSPKVIDCMQRAKDEIMNAVVAAESD